MNGTADVSALNYRRGLHRLGLIAWILWGVLVVLSPLWIERDSYTSAVAAFDAGYRACLQAAENQTASRQETCREVHRDMIARVKASHQFGSIYAKSGTQFAWLVVIAGVGVPLLFYGIIRVGVALVRWIANGFRSEQRRPTAQA